jgi:hypothetical protein
VLLSAAYTSPGLALTGADVLQKMSADERSGYLAGNIDMAAQLIFRDGKHERSTCIFNWYYKGGGVAQVLQALERFKDKQVQPVIYALIDRACGE